MHSSNTFITRLGLYNHVVLHKVTVYFQVEYLKTS